MPVREGAEQDLLDDVLSVTGDSDPGRFGASKTSNVSPDITISLDDSRNSFAGWAAGRGRASQASITEHRRHGTRVSGDAGGQVNISAPWRMLRTAAAFNKAS